MRKAREFVKGFLLLFLLHAIAYCAVAASGAIFLKGWAFVGFFLGWQNRLHAWQFLYAIPTLVWLVERRKRYMAGGVAVGVIITVGTMAYLLNIRHY